MNNKSKKKIVSEKVELEKISTKKKKQKEKGGQVRLRSEERKLDEVSKEKSSSEE